MRIFGWFWCQHRFIWKLYDGPKRLECQHCPKIILIPEELTKARGAFSEEARRKANPSIEVAELERLYRQSKS